MPEHVYVVTEDNPEGPGVFGLYVYGNKSDAEDHVARVAEENGQEYADEYMTLTTEKVR